MTYYCWYSEGSNWFRGNRNTNASTTQGITHPIIGTMAARVVGINYLDESIEALDVIIAVTTKTSVLFVDSTVVGDEPFPMNAGSF